ncbi:DUF4240 domain-containing protein [Streptacidiphilus neutrinimicus]|uniref:DUF4240 domain-containing protein n=1 Tax=Streptacidiphilus neutrinimicus TaxID=105420 RepID=UPI0005A94CAC|nr:DUF4240 domain-containing protein [Streptacidiphilus neutrinimicus]
MDSGNDAGGTRGFWQLIEQARAVGGAADCGAADCGAVAATASALLAQREVGEIVAAQRALWTLMEESYRSPLWAAAYLINGGCSDDGFDYFRGWLILQGQEVFERVIAEPDVLAELAPVREAAAHGLDLEGEEALAIAWDAHRRATGGEELPAGSFSVRYPELDQAWNFDFDDMGEMRRRLPRLAALYAGEPAV